MLECSCICWCPLPSVIFASISRVREQFLFRVPTNAHSLTPPSLHYCLSAMTIQVQDLSFLWLQLHTCRMCLHFELGLLTGLTLAGTIPVYFTDDHVVSFRPAKGSVLAAFERYTALGELLRDDDHDVPLQSSIENVMGDTRLVKPFVLLDGPSGIGKTQQFFALKGFHVIYIVLTEMEAEAQHIYLAFQSLSDGFLSALGEDLRLLEHLRKKSGFDSMSTGFLRTVTHTKLQTVGLMLKVMGFVLRSEEGNCLRAQATSNEEVHWTSESIESLKAYVAKNGLSEKIVIALDELPQSVGPNKHKNLFCRSLFRLCGLVGVLSGTDSTAKNAVLDHSRVTDEPVFWAEAQTQTHPVTLDSLQLSCPDLRQLAPDKLRPYEAMMLNSRPLLAFYLARAIVNHPDAKLDFLIDAVAGVLYRSKPSLRSEIGLVGQIAMTMKAYQLLDGDRIATANALVVGHMAKLDFQKFDRNTIGRVQFFVKPGGKHNYLCVNDSEHSWIPISHFPHIGEDVLLFLVLLGTKNHVAFQDPHDRFMRMSTIGAMSSAPLMRCILQSPSQMPFGNSHTASNDGKSLEAKSVTAMCISSHENGVMGSSLLDFVGNLCRELHEPPCKIADWCGCKVDTRGEPLFPSAWSTLVVPYMFPPMYEQIDLPSWMSQHGCFAVLHRPPDHVQYDIDVIYNTPKPENALIITGEDKDYAKRLDAGNLIPIIKRIPPHTQVTFIFCKDVTDGAFERSDPFFAKGCHGENVTLLVVEMKKDVTPPEVMLRLLNKTTCGPGDDEKKRQIAIILPLTKLNPA